MDFDIQHSTGERRERGKKADAGFVSVVTPFYNSVETLGRCIASILGQSHANFEYVLSDNASDDGSGEIARAAAARGREGALLPLDGPHPANR